jgi:hypothetical protein
VSHPHDLLDRIAQRVALIVTDWGDRDWDVDVLRATGALSRQLKRGRQEHPYPMENRQNNRESEDDVEDSSQVDLSMGVRTCSGRKRARSRLS